MVRKIYDDVRANICEYFALVRKMAIPVLILASAYAVSFFAIFRADFYYIDDISRAYHGMKGWEYFSRYLSNIFSRLFSTGNYLTDVSPLTQLSACVLLAFAGIICLYAITDKTKFSVWQYIAASFFGLTPFFLECISYKYDSVYMAFSIFISAVPMLFYKKNKIFYGFTVFVCILMMCMTYQAASGILPMLTVLIMAKMWNDKCSYKDILKFFLSSIVGYLSALVFFKLFIMQKVDNYASGNMPSASGFFPNAIENYKAFFTNVKNDLRAEWLILAALIGVSFVYAFIRNSKQKKYIAAIVAVVATLLMIALCFGAYPFLLQPIIAPRAMYGFGAMISLWAIYMASSKKIYWAKLVSVALCWMFVVFAFSYGNALASQKQYTEYRISSTVDDLIHLGLLDGDEVKKVQITGSIGQDITIRNMPQDFQMMNRLIPVTFGDSGWHWGRYEFEFYYGLKNIEFDNSIDLTTYDLPVLEDNIYHTIKSDGKHILIQLKP